MKFRLTAFCLICGLAMMFMGGKGVITYMMPPVDIYAEDCDWTKLRSGQRVKVNLDFVLEPIVVTSRKEDGVKVDVSAIYAVPDLREADDGLVYMTHYMGVFVKAADFEKYNTIAKASYAWWIDFSNTTPFGEGGYDEFDGSLRKMSKKEKGYMRDYLAKAGYPTEDIENKMVPLVLVKNNSLKSNIMFLLLGFVFTVAGVIFGFLFYIRKK